MGGVEVSEIWKELWVVKERRLDYICMSAFCDTFHEGASPFFCSLPVLIQNLGPCLKWPGNMKLDTKDLCCIR